MHRFMQLGIDDVGDLRAYLAQHPTAHNWTDRPWLITMAEVGRIDFLNVLIHEFSLDVNVTGGAGYGRKTPLSAATMAGNTEVMRILLDAGADVNLGKSIMQATLAGNTEALEILLDAGANTDVVEDRFSPLTMSQHAGSLECVTLLANHRGFDLDRVDAGGRLLFESFEMPGAKRIFLEAGCSLEDPRGRGHLVNVLQVNQVATELLIDHGSSFYMRELRRRPVYERLRIHEECRKAIYASLMDGKGFAAVTAQLVCSLLLPCFVLAPDASNVFVCDYNLNVPRVQRHDQYLRATGQVLDPEWIY